MTHVQKKKKNGSRRFLLLMAGAALATSSEGVLAEQWHVDPYARLLQEYDDNVRFEADNADAGATTVLTGAVLLGRSTEISSVAATLRADAVKYWAGAGDVDDEINYGAELSAQRKGERHALLFDGEVKRDNLLRSEAPIQFDDVAIEPGSDVDQGLVTESVDRTRIDLRPQWSYSLDERSEVGVGYRYKQTTYGDNSADLNDYRYQTVDGYWSYGLTETDQVTTTLIAGRYDSSDGGSDYDFYQGVVGFVHEFSQISRGGIDVGLVQADWDSDGSDGDEQDYTVSVFYAQRGERTAYRIRVAREITPSGTGTLVLANEAIARVTYELSPLAKLSVRALVREDGDLNEGGGAADNRRYASFEPTVTWQLTRWWALEGGYRYRWQEFDDTSGSARSNSIFVALKYEVPTLE